MKPEEFSIHSTSKGAVLAFMGSDFADAEATFRKAFPRASWQSGLRQWFVYGTDAEWQLIRWRDAYLAKQSVLT